MKVPIQDMLFLHLGQRGLGGSDCAPSRFEWEAVATGAPARFYDDLCMRDAPNHPRPRVGWLVEAPPYAQCHYDWAAEHEAEFDAILTPCQKWADRGGPWRWYPRGGSMLRRDDAVPRTKWRKVSFLASDKADAEGHKLRHAIYDKYGYKLDCFGAITGHDYVDKVAAVGPYFYTVVVDAERNAGCFCDHVLDAFLLEAVPIYWGCPDIGRWFDADGIIQFESASALPGILAGLSAHDYAERLPAVRANAELARRYRVPEDWLFDHHHDLFNGLE